MMGEYYTYRTRSWRRMHSSWLGYTCLQAVYTTESSSFSFDSGGQLCWVYQFSLAYHVLLGLGQSMPDSFSFHSFETSAVILMGFPLHVCFLLILPFLCSVQFLIDFLLILHGLHLMHPDTIHLPVLLRPSSASATLSPKIK